MVACLTQTVKLETDRYYTKLQRWKNHHEQFPLLSYGQSRLRCPKQQISVAGRTVTAQRASMAPEKVEDVVSVNTNIRQLREFNMKK